MSSIYKRSSDGRWCASIDIGHDSNGNRNRHVVYGKTKKEVHRKLSNLVACKVGPGGAPTRATTLPEEPKARKKVPIASGVLDYFPDAIVAIAKLSQAGNDQHNPGQSLRWARDKSGDEADTLMRHFLQRGTVDTDGISHTVKVAWRALALLQKEIEAEQAGESS